jgi:hypothetical protein
MNTPLAASSSSTETPACESCNRSIADRVLAWEQAGRRYRRPVLCLDADCKRARAAARKRHSRRRAGPRGKRSVPAELADSVEADYSTTREVPKRTRRRYSAKGRQIPTTDATPSPEHLPGILQIAAVGAPGWMSSAAENRRNGQRPQSVPEAPLAERSSPAEVLAFIDDVIAALDDVVDQLDELAAWVGVGR